MIIETEIIFQDLWCSIIIFGINLFPILDIKHIFDINIVLIYYFSCSSNLLVINTTQIGAYLYYVNNYNQYH